MASFESELPESAWAQIQYKHQISDSCHEKMRTKMDEVNESRETKTVTLYHMLHGDKRAESRFLSYAPQIPCNFAAANQNPEYPLWYSLIVEQDLNHNFPKLSKKPELKSDQDQEDRAEIQYMLEIRNGFSKKASSQDVEHVKLLHDLIFKVEVFEKQALESGIHFVSETPEDDDEEDTRKISGIFTEKSIATIRHVLYEFMHYNWEHGEMKLYCSEHLQERWLHIKAKSAPHHVYVLMQKLEEIAGLVSENRLTIPMDTNQIPGNKIFATHNIIHPLPHLFKGPPCTTTYFVELWRVTDLATEYINTRTPDPEDADYEDVIKLLDHLQDAWLQDLSLLYKSDSPLFQDPKEETAIQIASLNAIKAQEPTFCSFGVLPRWHGIPYQHAQIKEKWGVTDDDAEDLEGHLHVAYDKILTRLNDEDAEMENGDCDFERQR
jgi:hypothetical protein